MVRTHSLLATLASTALAILPYSPDRYVSSDDTVLVSEVVDVPSSYQKHLEELTSSSTSTSKSTVVSIKPSQVNSTSTVLNIIPGISLLETDDDNECYYVNTTIGTTEYPLIIDTGSAYLWVYGSDCDDTACEDHSVYTSASSSGSDTATSTFALAYVTGTASGVVVEDNIIVNKLATTEKFRFGMAESVPDFFDKYPVSGIFGLPSNDSSSIESIISALYQSHAISTKRFSICLGQVGSNDSDYSNAGIFSIGDPVEELYTGDIHYVPLMSTASLYWQIVIDSVYMDGYQVEFENSMVIEGDNSTVERSAIVDSGTTVLALPAQDALDVHAYFPDSVTDGTNFAIYCNSTLDITLELNGHNWTIGPDEYLGDAYSKTSGYDGYCVSNIQGVSSDSIDSWILGSVFLKTVYADFDVEDQQVGFATRNTDIILTSTSTATSSATSSAATTISTSATATATSSNSTNTTSSYKDSGVAIAGGISIFSVMIPVLAILL